jgi:hypothetical protein
MADASFSMSRGVSMDDLANGVQAVTEGTSAPGAGDIEIRINLAAGLTKREIKELLEVMWRYLSDTNFSTSVPL